MFAHGETVTRLRGVAATDPYSSDATVIDWTDPDELTLTGCAVWDGRSADSAAEFRDAVVSDFVVAADPGSDVLASDRVVIRGMTCEVDGRPFDWRSPFTGWHPGLVFRANIVEG